MDIRAPTLNNLVLPDGFLLVGSFPLNIAPDSIADFTIQMNTADSGGKFGTLRFSTNDTDEAVFNFLIQGLVTGNVPSGSPAIGLPGPAVPFVMGDDAKLIDSMAVFVDSDSVNLQQRIAAGRDHSGRQRTIGWQSDILKAMEAAKSA